jgi:hypothetical protein
VSALAERPAAARGPRARGPDRPPDIDAAGPVVPARLTLLAEPVGRAELMADPDARDAEMLRMPAGSNPSWLSRAQFDVVLARVPDRGAATGLGPWSP